MAKLTKFVPVKCKDGWRLNIPPKYSQNGKRERHFYKTRKEADEEAVKLRNKRDEFGQQSKTISPSVVEQAHQANQILIPWGKTLVEAAGFLAKSLENEQSSIPFEDAGALWQDSCEGELRDSTLKSYKYTVERLKITLAGRIMSTISGEEIEAALKTKGATSYAMHRRNARVLWSWAAKTPRKWCDTSVFDSVTIQRKKITGEITILKPTEVKALLTTAEEHYPKTVCVYAVALFAGVRAEEIQRLSAHNFNEDGIEIPADAAKKGRRRHVPMNHTLRKWLEEYPFEAQTNWQEVDKAIRRLAGWDVSARLLKTPPEPTRGPWPQNVLRHTHASAAVANGATLEDLLFSFGHSNGHEILKRHYVGRYTKKDAVAFWSVGPKGTIIPVITEVPAPAAKKAAKKRKKRQA